MAKLDKNPRPKLTLFPRLVSRRGRCKTDPGGEDAFAAPRHSAGLATISPWPCASLAWGQMTGMLSYVAHSFGENWRMGLAALLDRPAALFYIVGVVAVLALTFSGFRVGSRVGYRRGQFLSANEEMFLRTLDAALGGNYRAFAQVRLVEIANPADSANVRLRRRALNAVMAKSIDFVICDVLALDPVAAIEVDDRSHLLPERRERDAFVNAVFAEIGVPLLRVKAQPSYSVAELRALLARADLYVPRQSGASF